MTITLGEIVAALGGTLNGNAIKTIHGLSSLESASHSDISFLSNSRYRKKLARCEAGCVVISSGDVEYAAHLPNYIIATDPYVYFARLTQLWAKKFNKNKKLPSIHPSAVVCDNAFVHESAYVGPLCVVENDASIGANTVLHSRVHVGTRCVIGARCILHPGVVVGADGFGFARDGERWEKIEQLGAVHIGNDVEVGANTCIDRGALVDTLIEDGVKLDNLVQIGHNVRVGRNTAMAGCVGVAGSATIGSNCTIGGGAIVLGHLTLVDKVDVSAGTIVTRSILQPGQYTGFFPIDRNANWERNAASVKQLYHLRERVRLLERALLSTQSA